MRKLIWQALLLTIVLVGIQGTRRDAAAQTQKEGQIKFIRTVPRPDDEATRFADPKALALDVQGNVFVVDSGNSRIIKFDNRGRVVATVGGFGWQNEEFDTPSDISAKSTLDVFVADWQNQRIERYDKDLNYISTLVANENDNLRENLQFAFPIALDVSRHGELFVCDSEYDRIIKFNAFGKPVMSFGDYNSAAGGIRKVGKIVISAEDIVVVADEGAKDIVLFDYYGNFTARIGRGSFESPSGVATFNREIYVTDVSAHKVVVLGIDGSKKFEWGNPGAFDSPRDVAVDDKHVYVLDSGNNRVQVFSRPVRQAHIE